jgi:hypothetical protein
LTKDLIRDNFGVIMEFLKKKEKQDTAKTSSHKTLLELAQERVLTAEGWRRRMLKKAKKSK